MKAPSITTAAQSSPGPQSTTNTPKKILFDHLPKCGGSSLSAYLVAHYSKQKIFSIRGGSPYESIKEFKNYPLSKRHGYDLIQGHYANHLFDYIAPDCLKITMLRDPIDRVVSHYYYAKRTPGHYLYAKIHESEMTLEDYVTSGISDELQNWYTSYFSGLTLEEAEKNPEKSLSGAIEAVNKYDMIGFLDNFSSFVDELRHRASLKQKYQNKKVNVTTGRIKIADLRLSTIDIINEINYLDVEFFKKIKSAFG